ncbi:MAG: EamA family transporter, partial [Pseudolabrys sp.]|nr:EamA family transporter [Pseudolabrys sp.]
MTSRLTPRHPHQQGAWAMTLSMATFVAGDSVLKFLGGAIPTQELVFLRSAVIVAGIALLLLFRRQRLRLDNLLKGPVLLRCAFDALNILTFVTAIVHLGLATLYAILLTSPLMMTILAVVFLKEPVGWRRWSAIIAGFGGALMVIKPDFHAFDPWAAVGLLAALGAAARDTATRRIDPGTPTTEVAFYAAALAGLLS